jgi:hypothetical protein
MKQVLTDLKSLIEFASGQAEKQFRRTGVFYPMYHAIQADGQQLILPAMDEDKDVGVALIKAAFMLNDVDRYVFIDEAWILDHRKDGREISDAEMERINRYGLEHHPDRREVLMFAAENRKGEMQTATRFILRPESGKAKLAPLRMDDMKRISGSEGRMVGLLRW